MEDKNMKIMPRMFNYNNIVLDDPDPQMSPEEVKSFYENIYPELTQSNISGPQLTEDGLEYKFERVYGTKGITVAELASMTSAPTPEEDNNPNVDPFVMNMRLIKYVKEIKGGGHPAPSEGLEPI